MRRRLLILIIILCFVGIVCGLVSLLLPKASVPIADLEVKVSSKILNLNLPPVAVPAPLADLSWHEVKNIPWSARDSHAVFLFQNKLWFLGGLSVPNPVGPVSMAQYETATYFNDIWSTADGEHWKQEILHATFPPIRSSSVIAFNGELFMFGGWSPLTRYKNGIWKSKDGINWEQVAAKSPWGEREGQKVVIFNNKLWLFGGVNYDQAQIFNDVWSSADGLNWEQVSAINPWKPRWDHDVAVFQNKLWLAGGMAFAGIGYGDVWSSTDGQSWQLETAEAPWKPRQGVALDVWQDKLWLVGGLDSATNVGVGDSWYTSDGQTWEQLPVVGPWKGREDHGVAVFLDKLWVIGGMDTDWHWNNDVWNLR